MTHVPEGWRLVPVEPTEMMFSATREQYWEAFQADYRAILDAAPAAPVQQADPVEQIGWADEFGNLFPMGAWKPAQRTWRDSHKTAWRPVFLHPPAAEVQRLRDALTAICAVADDREEGNYDTVPIHFIRSIARDATKGGK